MQTELPDILASRLNFDVIAFRGNTRQEMIVIGLISLGLTSLTLASLTKIFLGMLLVGVGLSFPLSIPVGWAFATIMQKFKDGKPKGYVKQRFLLWCENQGIRQSPYIRHSGKWSVRRFLQ